MLYFTTRSAARTFAAKVSKSVTDLGASSPKRWAVKVVVK